MAMGFSLVAFVVGAVVSLATSWVLVSRLERVGERLGLSEALLGMAAALAADAPEITASVTALLHHQQAVGAGVVVGSNVFNLAALLGLGAVVSGGKVLHRWSGSVARWPWPSRSFVCWLWRASLLLRLASWSPSLSSSPTSCSWVPGTGYSVDSTCRLDGLEWLASAVVEEEVELEVAIHPSAGRAPTRMSFSRH